MEVADRIVVVTGAARGIGRALARGFATAGAEAVVVVDADGDAASTVAREIGGKAIECDMSREEEVAHMVSEVHTANGRIDIFCSNAGIAVGGGPEGRDSDWQRTWGVNVMARVFVARHVLPRMLDRKVGYLLGTVSAAGLLNHVFAAPYGVTKAAALSLFEWLSITHGDEGIRVSCLCPQGVKTDMLAAERAQLGVNFLTGAARGPEA